MTSLRLHPRAISAVAIDLDGTLADTLGDFDIALNRTLAQLGLPGVGVDAISRMVGKGSEHLIRAVLAHVGAPAGLEAPAWTLYQQHYAAINGEHTRIYPGVREGLDMLADLGLPLACLTNKPGALARELLARKGLDHMFRVVFGGDAFERKKPDPLPLVKTCEALGSAPAATLMVGDSSNDAAAARAAGCPVVLMTYGYNHGVPVHAVDADGFFDSLADVAQRLLSSPAMPS